MAEIQGKDWHGEIGTPHASKLKYDDRSEFYSKRMQLKLGQSFDDVIKNLVENGYKTLEDHKGKNRTIDIRKGDTLFVLLKKYYMERFSLPGTKAEKETYLTLAYVMKTAGSPGNVDELEIGGKIEIKDGKLKITNAAGEEKLNAHMRPKGTASAGAREDAEGDKTKDGKKEATKDADAEEALPPKGKTGKKPATSGTSTSGRGTSGTRRGSRSGGRRSGSGTPGGSTDGGTDTGGEHTDHWERGSGDFDDVPAVRPIPARSTGTKSKAGKMPGTTPDSARTGAGGEHTDHWGRGSGDFDDVDPARTVPTRASRTGGTRPDSGRTSGPPSGPDGSPWGTDTTPPAGGTDTTPPAGGTDTTPPAGGTDTTPPAGGTDTTPPAGGTDTTPPAGGTDTTPPAGGTDTTPPAGGTDTTPPAGGTDTTPPAGGTDTTPPAGGTDTTPPAGGTDTTPPAGGTDTTPPAGGTDTTPPAGGTDTTPPAGGTDTTPPGVDVLPAGPTIEIIDGERLDRMARKINPELYPGRVSRIEIHPDKVVVVASVDLAGDGPEPTGIYVNHKTEFPVGTKPKKALEELDTGRVRGELINAANQEALSKRYIEMMKAAAQAIEEKLQEKYPNYRLIQVPYNEMNIIHIGGEIQIEITVETKQEAGSTHNKETVQVSSGYPTLEYENYPEKLFSPDRIDSYVATIESALNLEPPSEETPDAQARRRIDKLYVKTGPEMRGIEGNFKKATGLPTYSTRLAPDAPSIEVTEAPKVSKSGDEYTLTWRYQTRNTQKPGLYTYTYKLTLTDEQLEPQLDDTHKEADRNTERTLLATSLLVQGAQKQVTELSNQDPKPEFFEPVKSDAPPAGSGTDTTPPAGSDTTPPAGSDATPPEGDGSGDAGIPHEDVRGVPPIPEQFVAVDAVDSTGESAEKARILALTTKRDELLRKHREMKPVWAESVGLKAGADRNLPSILIGDLVLLEVKDTGEEFTVPVQTVVVTYNTKSPIDKSTTNNISVANTALENFNPGTREEEARLMLEIKAYEQIDYAEIIAAYKRDYPDAFVAKPGDTPPAGSDTTPPAGSDTTPPAGTDTTPPAGSDTPPDAEVAAAGPKELHEMSLEELQAEAAAAYGTMQETILQRLEPMADRITFSTLNGVYEQPSYKLDFTMTIAMEDGSNRELPIKKTYGIIDLPDLLLGPDGHRKKKGQAKYLEVAKVEFCTDEAVLNGVLGEVTQIGVEERKRAEQEAARIAKEKEAEEARVAAEKREANATTALDILGSMDSGDQSARISEFPTEQPQDGHWKTLLEAAQVAENSGNIKELQAADEKLSASIKAVRDNPETLEMSQRDKYLDVAPAMVVKIREKIRHIEQYPAEGRTKKAESALEVLAAMDTSDQSARIEAMPTDEKQDQMWKELAENKQIAMSEGSTLEQLRATLAKVQTNKAEAQNNHDTLKMGKRTDFIRQSTDVENRIKKRIEALEEADKDPLNSPELPALRSRLESTFEAHEEFSLVKGSNPALLYVRAGDRNFGRVRFVYEGEGTDRKLKLQAERNMMQPEYDEMYAELEKMVEQLNQ